VLSILMVIMACF